MSIVILIQQNPMNINAIKIINFWYSVKHFKETKVTKNNLDDS